MAQELTEACIGRSPFAADALMTEAFFDDFQIYDVALDGGQMKELYARVQGRAAESREVDMSAAREELARFMKKFNSLHATTDLPEKISDRVGVRWFFSVNQGYEDAIALENEKLVVHRLPQGDEAVRAGVLSAKLSCEADTVEVEYPVMLAPDDNRYGYLYCFMNSGKEITNFALGAKEDKGRVFNVLLDGDEIFDTEKIAEIEHGTRDAYIGRGEASDGYFITTTDMKQHASGVWNNHGINLIRSRDLIHWEGTTFDFNRGKSIFSDPDVTTGVYDTDEEYARINRAYGRRSSFGTRTITGEKVPIWCTIPYCPPTKATTMTVFFIPYADREFKTLTQPRVFFRPRNLGNRRGHRV